MAKFKFDINKTLEYCDKMDALIESYEQLTSNTLKNAKETEKYWKDPSSEAFNKIVVDDATSITALNDGIKQYEKIVYDFAKELKDVFVLRNLEDPEFKKINLVIEYDTPYVELTKSEFSSISSNLGSALSCMDAYCPFDSGLVGKINSVKTALRSDKSFFDELGTDVDLINKDIKKMVIDYNTKEKLVDLEIVEEETTRFVWSLVSVLPKSDPTLQEAAEVTVAVSEINSTSKVDRLNSTHEAISGDIGAEDTSLTVGTLIADEDEHFVADSVRAKGAEVKAMQEARELRFEDMNQTTDLEKFLDKKSDDEKYEFEEEKAKEFVTSIKEVDESITGFENTISTNVTVDGLNSVEDTIHVEGAGTVAASAAKIETLNNKADGARVLDEIKESATYVQGRLYNDEFNRVDIATTAVAGGIAVTGLKAAENRKVNLRDKYHADMESNVKAEEFNKLEIDNVDTKEEEINLQESIDTKINISSTSTKGIENVNLKIDENTTAFNVGTVNSTAKEAIDLARAKSGEFIKDSVASAAQDMYGINPEDAVKFGVAGIATKVAIDKMSKEDKHEFVDENVKDSDLSDTISEENYSNEISLDGLKNENDKTAKDIVNELRKAEEDEKNFADISFDDNENNVKKPGSAEEAMAALAAVSATKADDTLEESTANEIEIAEEVSTETETDVEEGTTEDLEIPEGEESTEADTNLEESVAEELEIPEGEESTEAETDLQESVAEELEIPVGEESTEAETDLQDGIVDELEIPVGEESTEAETDLQDGIADELEIPVGEESTEAETDLQDGIVDELEIPVGEESTEAEADLKDAITKDLEIPEDVNTNADSANQEMAEKAMFNGFDKDADANGASMEGEYKNSFAAGEESSTADGMSLESKYEDTFAASESDTNGLNNPNLVAEEDESVNLNNIESEEENTNLKSDRIVDVIVKDSDADMVKTTLDEAEEIKPEIDVTESQAEELALEQATQTNININTVSNGSITTLDLKSGTATEFTGPASVESQIDAKDLDRKMDSVTIKDNIHDAIVNDYGIKGLHKVAMGAAAVEAVSALGANHRQNEKKNHDEEDAEDES